MTFNKSIESFIADNIRRETDKKLIYLAVGDLGTEDIAKAAMKILQERREIMGGEDIISEKTALEYCDLLIKYMEGNDQATSIAAERLMREELKKAYDGQRAIDVIDKIEPVLVFKDL